MNHQEPTVRTLHELLDHDARRFSAAEALLGKSLDEWIGRSQSLKLKSALQKYRERIEAHLNELEAFIAEEGIGSLDLRNRVMQAFIDEANEKLLHCVTPATYDACLIAGVQAINHFKISAYGTAASFARALGMEKHALLFHRAEIDEKQIDDRLTQLAEFEVNKNALTTIALPS